MTVQATRARAPRRSHGEWSPHPHRPDPVDVLEEQAASRVSELVPIRYGRMLASPLAFYRGAAAIMAGDLAGTPTSGVAVQLCGDAHLSNFGIYAAPDRRLVFDVNDFDETLPGPWEWDVKRLVASFEVAGRQRGFKAARRRAIVLEAAREYREAMRRFARQAHLDVWYARLDADQVLDDWAADASRADLRAGRRTVARARARDSRRAVSRLTERVDGELRFRSDPPLLMRLHDLLPDDEAARMRGDILGLLQGYGASLAPHVRRLVSTYRPVDMARKVVGVGSVGTRAWIVLLQGRDERDPLILQAKEAQASVLEAHLGRSRYASHAKRVVYGQRAMQAASDVFLGWQHVRGIDGVERDFYVRQLWDGKGSADVDRMPAGRMELYAGICAWTLARAHARSGDREEIAAYLGQGDRFDRAMVAFADRYADQNEQDFAALAEAADAGRIAVTPIG